MKESFFFHFLHPIVLLFLSRPSLCPPIGLSQNIPVIVPLAYRALDYIPDVASLHWQVAMAKKPFAYYLVCSAQIVSYLKYYGSDKEEEEKDD